MEDLVFDLLQQPVVVGACYDQRLTFHFQFGSKGQKLKVKVFIRKTMQPILGRIILKTCKQHIQSYPNHVVYKTKAVIITNVVSITVHESVCVCACAYVYV